MKTIRDYINLIENLQREGVAEGLDENYKFHMIAFLKDGKIKEFNVIADTDRNAKILAKKKLIEKGFNKIDSIDIQGMSPVRGRKNAFEDQGVAEEQVEESSPDAIAKINELTRR